MTPQERAESRAQGKASYPMSIPVICYCGEHYATYELMSALDPTSGVKETLRALKDAHRKTARHKAAD